METAFELIMQLSEEQLARVYGDFQHHRIMYKSTILYDGEFHENGLLDFSSVKALIPYQHTYSQEQWIGLMRTAYASYASEYPKRCRHLNFIPADKESFELFYPAWNFHHARVALDILVVFAYHEGLFIWDNLKLFMLKVCDNCVVLRDWVVKNK